MTDGKGDRDETKDARELDTARGGRFHRVPGVPGAHAPVHGDFTHSIRTNGVTFEFRDLDDSHCELRIVDQHGHIVVQASLTEDDAAGFEMQFAVWRGRLGKRNFRG